MINNELRHWGIKGMRWGIRRYQNKDGSLTPAGRIRYADEEERKEQEDYEKQRREEYKQRAINSGDVDKVSRWRGEMSNDEFRKALDRVDLEKRLQKQSSESTESGFDKTMNVVGKIDQARSAGEKLVNAYNLIAKINNTFNRKFKMTEIDGKSKDIVDAYKDTLLNTASAKEVAKNLDRLTADEKAYISKRLANEENIRKSAASEP